MQNNNKKKSLYQNKVDVISLSIDICSKYVLNSLQEPRIICLILTSVVSLVGRECDRPGVVPHYKYCYIIYNTNITFILFSAIIAFLVVMLLHLTVSRKFRNNLKLAAKN